MVNYGVSRGCHACKERHKKCDETRPLCLRCERASRDCPGYELNKDRKFINYIGEANFNLLHRRPTYSSYQTSDSTQFNISDWPKIEQEARLAFIDDYCIVSSNKNLSRGYLDGLQAMITRSGPSSELLQACTIIPLANVGKKLGSKLHMKRAEELYSMLLRSFRLSISNEAIFTTIESLVTAALLGLYEIIISTDAHSGAHVGHARGVSAILVSKYSPFDLICGGKLFQVASPILLENTEAENFNSPLPSDPPVSTRKVSQRFSVLCTPLFNRSSTAIDLLYAQIEPLLRRAESLLKSDVPLDQLHQLLSEAQQMKEAYDAWPNTVPEEWNPRIEGFIVSEDDETE